MGTYFTDNTGRQKFRDKRVYTKRQSSNTEEFILASFKNKKSNFHRFEDLKMYLYATKSKWSQEDLELFAELAKYKKGWAYHKTIEVKAFLLAPLPKDTLSENNYEKLTPSTFITEGVHKGKRLKEVEELDPNYAVYFKEQEWFNIRKLRPQVEKTDMSSKWKVGGYNCKSKVHVNEEFDLFLIETLNKVRNNTILNIKSVKVKEYIENNGYVFSEDMFNSLLKSKQVVKVGNSTYDLAKNYYTKTPIERYQSFYDTLTFLNEMNIENLKREII